VPGELEAAREQPSAVTGRLAARNSYKRNAGITLQLVERLR